MRIIIATLLVLLCSMAIASDSTTIPNGQTVDINAHGVCKRVANNSGQSQYVPTVSSGEWSSFYSTSHAGVTIIDCPAGCSGFSYGGYCWYAGSAGQSCTTVCASHGGCSEAGVNLGGSDGAICLVVVNAIFNTSYTYPGWPWADGGLHYGCWKSTVGAQAPYFGTGTCATSYGFAKRVCACIE